jgi:HAE1 family hydrophobic/amphiphilic exporter-1
MPPGTSLTATDALCRELERKVQSLPDVKAAVANVGQIVGGFGSIPKQGSPFAQVTVFLKPKQGFLEGGERTRTDETVAAQLRSELAPLAKQQGGRVTAAAVRSLQGLASGIQFQVLGDDMEALLKYAEEARTRLAQIPGVIDPQLTVRTGDPELRVVVDSRKAAQYGIPMNFAGAIARDSLTGNTESLYRERGEEFPIRVRLREDQRRTLADVRNIAIGADNQNANQGLLLSDIAAISYQTAPANIERYNGQRAITLSANLSATATLQDVANAFREILDSIPHSGISYTEAGDAKTLEENIPHFVNALGLAIILVYIVMASLFNSLGTPFVIMFTLPMALIGAFGALAITGESLSLVSGIGIIMLVGLMGRNAILLLDYTNTLRERGMERTEALIQAGATRLRPILMTTTCTIVGMMPVALRMGQAAELRAPMAIAVIGGLLVSTLLTLIMIPVIYSAWDDMAGRRQR